MQLKDIFLICGIHPSLNLSVYFILIFIFIHILLKECITLRMNGTVPVPLLVPMKRYDILTVLLTVLYCSISKYISYFLFWYSKELLPGVKTV